MSTVVRGAEPADVAELVGLRLVNATWHPTLDAMVEVVTVRDPPDHQILVPRRAAEVHTVVRPGERGQGLGRRMVEAAARAAAERGIEIRYAGIHARNDRAVRFNTAAGFGPRGTTLSRELGG